MHAGRKTWRAILIPNPCAGFVVDDDVVVNPVALRPKGVVSPKVQPDAIGILVVHEVAGGFELGYALDGAPGETPEVRIFGVAEKLGVEHAALRVGNAHCVVVVDAQVARSKGSIGIPDGYADARPRDGLAVEVLACGS